MLETGLLCLFVIVIELYFCVDSALFPEDRDRTSDLEVGKTVIIDEDDLFGFTEIGHMAFGVEPSGVIASASFFPGSPG